MRFKSGRGHQSFRRSAVQSRPAGKRRACRGSRLNIRDRTALSACASCVWAAAYRCRTPEYNPTLVRSRPCPVRVGWQAARNPPAYPGAQAVGVGVVGAAINSCHFSERPLLSRVTLACGGRPSGVPVPLPPYSSPKSNAECPISWSAICAALSVGRAYRDLPAGAAIFARVEGQDTLVDLRYSPFSNIFRAIGIHGQQAGDADTAGRHATKTKHRRR